MTRPAEPAAPGYYDATALSGAFVVLGVSGGIAAYKAVELCRRLIDLGAHVAPVLTPGALRFVGEATFSALGSERAHTSLFDDDEPIPHTRLGQKADLVLVAPATARVLGSYGAGISADLLVATLLATRAPVLVCPAMHTEMWEHPAVQENLATLRRRGVHVLEPVVGRLAGGDVGAGRLAEPVDIVVEAARILSEHRSGPMGNARPSVTGNAGVSATSNAADNADGNSGVSATSNAAANADGNAADAAATGKAAGNGAADLAGRRVLVTAGGTREPIDPVRFIANRSSGKQGYALAEAARVRGADVTLVTTVQRPAPAGIEIVEVETAAEMADAVLSRAQEQDLIVMAAAVADFRPSAPAVAKIRKAEGIPEIALEPTLDILAELGRRRRPGQVLVGFAAETESVVERAAEKLRSKGVDLVVGNDVAAEGVGFSHDTNAVSIVSADGRTEIPLSTKRAVADAVLDAALAHLGGPQVPQSTDPGANA
ncbi:MAG: bifunctional phosphopantothenoylcysteine decarboxylase/phosphopantothenate synthase [Acidimicrobiales bacterium]